MHGDPLRGLVLPRLNGIRKAGAGFVARCPAHDDHKASLTVGAGREQPVVFHCHAGCAPDDIVVKLGLTWEELSAPRESPARATAVEWTPAGLAVAVYDYRDEHDALLFQVLRTATKEFRQRVHDTAAKSGWTWKLGDVRRVLYRLREVISAVREGREVWIVEGEKDVHRLEHHGVVATCNPGGAGKWRPEYDEFLREARVVIVADKDSPGQAHARQVFAALTDVAQHVRIVEAVAGKDITDHLDAGYGLDQVVQTATTEAPPQLDLAPDLWEFISVNDEDYDWIVPHLLERGDRLMLTGFEGLGKSMLTRQLAVTIAAGLEPFTFEEIEPHRVLMIDCENSERQSRRKFRQLAPMSTNYHRRVPDGALRLIHRPEGINLTREDDAAWLYERVTAHRPDVLCIGPFYRLHTADMNDELPARRVIAVLDAVRTRMNCVLIIEAHSGHGDGGGHADSNSKRSVRPIGSSLLLRWPEFGLGLAPVDDPKPGERCKEVHLKAWRGARDERAWPSRLCYGGPNRWPWVSAAKEPE